MIEASADAVRYLLDNGVDVNEKDGDLEWTAINHALQADDAAEIIRLLIDRGATVDVEGEDNTLNGCNSGAAFAPILRQSFVQLRQPGAQHRSPSTNNKKFHLRFAATACRRSSSQPRAT